MLNIYIWNNKNTCLNLPLQTKQNKLEINSNPFIITLIIRPFSSLKEQNLYESYNLKAPKGQRSIWEAAPWGHMSRHRSLALHPLRSTDSYSQVWPYIKKQCLVEETRAAGKEVTKSPPLPAFYQVASPHPPLVSSQFYSTHDKVSTPDGPITKWLLGSLRDSATKPLREQEKLWKDIRKSVCLSFLGLLWLSSFPLPKGHPGW